ncbi:MAG: hypothetical protein JXR70_15270 [Spirochaetales bacterium]|nr:hypothetical protein [Spirochaetales bacterium]
MMNQFFSICLAFMLFWRYLPPFHSGRPGYPALRCRFEGFLPEIFRQKTLWLAIFEKIASHASYP